MTTLAEINASLQKLKPANQFQALTQEWINEATGVLEPAPPSGETRAVYVANGTDASVSALVPTLKAASYNTVFVAGQWGNTLAALKAAGMSAWATLGVWQQGGGWDQTAAQMIATAQQVVATLGVGNVVFYLADEPALGNTAFAAQILDFANQLRAAIPGARCMIAYYDAGSVGIYGKNNAAKLPPLDLVASSIYPNKFSFNWSLVTQFGAACGAAGLAFTSVIAIASDTPPLPSPVQMGTWASTAKAAGSLGFCVYAWGIGAEQAQYVAAVQALP